MEVEVPVEVPVAVPEPEAPAPMEVEALVEVEAEDKDAKPEEWAAAAAGLEWGQLTQQESVHFGLHDDAAALRFLTVRNNILTHWSRDTTVTLTAEACVAEGTSAEDAAYIVKVFKFLQLYGAVNVGLVEAAGQPLTDLLTPTDRPSVSAQRLLFELWSLLETVDLQVTTERQIRAELEGKLGVKLTEQKKQVREHVKSFLAGQLVKPPPPPATDAPLPAEAAEAVATMTVVVVGAGPAGLMAARHISKMGVKVVVLEARQRVGGRVHTDATSLSAPVDLGASIITGASAAPRRATATGVGVPADHSAVVCKQLGLTLRVADKMELPLYDPEERCQLSAETDKRVEQLRDRLLDDARRPVNEGLELLHGSLGAALDAALAAYEEAEGALSDLDRRVLHWHWAHIEYGCAAPLSKISLAHWNQDEEYGGFGGLHGMIPGGYSQVMEAMAQGLDVRHGAEVTKIEHSAAGVRVSTADGKTVEGVAVVVTTPLGVLKAGVPTFLPALPQWKADAISSLGFGNLNKVVLEFDSVFWDDSKDFFGAATSAQPAERGKHYSFWNMHGLMQTPVLTGIIAGEAADACEGQTDEELVAGATEVLRRIHPHVTVPAARKWAVTRWGGDRFTRGAYSYVAVGADGSAYDAMRKSCGDGGVIMFAGEHTCKSHPDTVGGAMLTGLMAAREALQVVKTKAMTPPLPPEERMAAFLEVEDDEKAETEAAKLLVSPKKRKAREVVKKRKATVLSDSDSEDDEEVRKQQEREKRQQQAREKVDQCQDQRAKGREELKEVWKEMRKIGDDKKLSPHDAMRALHAVMLSAASEPVRTILVQQCIKQPPEQLKAFAEDRELLVMLNDWLVECRDDGTTGGAAALISNTRPSNPYRVVSAEMWAGDGGLGQLRLLLRIPMDSLKEIRSAGLPDTLRRKCSNHTIDQIRALAEQVARKWSSIKTPAKAAKPPVKKTDGGAGAEAAVAAAVVGGGAVPTVVPTAAGFGAGPTAEARGDDEEAAGAGKEQQQQRVALSTEEATAIAEAEAAFRAAEAAAAAAAEVADQPAVELPKLMDFSRFSKKEKGDGKEKAKEKTKEKKGEEKEGKDSAKRAKHEHSGSGGKGDGSSSRSDGQKDKGSTGGDVKKEVGSWIKGMLDPLVASKKLGKSEAGTVLTKSLAKLADSIAAHTGKTGPFLTEHRQGKIRGLVDKYVANVADKKDKK